MVIISPQLHQLICIVLQNVVYTYINMKLELCKIKQMLQLTIERKYFENQLTVLVALQMIVFSINSNAIYERSI